MATRGALLSYLKHGRMPPRIWHGSSKDTALAIGYGPAQFRKEDEGRGRGRGNQHRFPRPYNI